MTMLLLRHVQITFYGCSDVQTYLSVRLVLRLVLGFVFDYIIFD